MIEIKDYQEKAILKLKEQINELLNRDSRETLVFKSPTGSGKTLMVAEFIKRLVDRRDDGKQIAFIWTAPRQLHTQSKEKLDKYYSTTRAIECKYFEDLTNNRLEPDEILFLNWESINKKENVYIRENEQEKNLSKVLENTREEGTRIVLIIDESHFTANLNTKPSHTLDNVNSQIRAVAQSCGLLPSTLGKVRPYQSPGFAHAHESHTRQPSTILTAPPHNGQGCTISSSMFATSAVVSVPHAAVGA